MRKYNCQECHNRSGTYNLLVKGPPGWLECKVCKRDVKDPGSVEDAAITYIPNHGLARKEMLAADAYQTTLPEFPIDENKLDDIDF